MKKIYVKMLCTTRNNKVFILRHSVNKFYFMSNVKVAISLFLILLFHWFIWKNAFLVRRCQNKGSGHAYQAPQDHVFIYLIRKYGWAPIGPPFMWKVAIKTHKRWALLKVGDRDIRTNVFRGLLGLLWKIFHFHFLQLSRYWNYF